MQSHGSPSKLLAALGGESGCQSLAAEFYARVAQDPVLRLLFPGKSLRCTTEELSAFLVQFFEGDEEQSQFRWWLSLRESHSRFQLDSVHRAAWLTQRTAALKARSLDEGIRQAFVELFTVSTAYLLNQTPVELKHDELTARWTAQLALDETIEAIASGRDDEAIKLAPRFVARKTVFVGLLARMVQTGRPALIDFVIDRVEKDIGLVQSRFAGRTLLHFAAGAGCLRVVDVLLHVGTDPNVLDRGNHTPLYSVANECSSAAGPDVVSTLIQAGADVNACGGVTRATALHMAARRGHLGIASALLDCGAAPNAKDRKGDTPWQRAKKCRKVEVAKLLEAFSKSE